VAFLATVVVLVAWWTGITRRFFDYDEIYHAHATWLIWQGKVPYQDFFACHSPFAWYLLAPLWSALPESPRALISLRLVSAMGVLAWLCVMGANFRLHRAEVSRSWTCLGMVLVLCTPSVMDFALEFRPDAWCYALLFAALLVFRLQWPTNIVARHAVFSFLSCAAVSANPKCALLATLFVPLELATSRSIKRALGACLGLAAGVGAASLIGWLFLRFAGIDALATYAFGIRYQALFEANTGFHYGLLQSLLARPLLLGLTLAGVVAWAIYLKRSGARPNAFELATVLFLLAQLVLAQRPYKQYYAPWLLTGAGFTPYLFLVIGQTRQSVAFAAAAALTLACSLNTILLLVQHHGARSMLQFHQAMLDMSDPSSKVVAWLPLHPVVRHDTFYGWNRTMDPAGYTTESIVQDLRLPEYARKFQEPDYWRQLEANPPTLIVATVPHTSSYEPKQAAVLEKFLQKHQAEYILVDQGLLCPVWQRRTKAPVALSDRGSPNPLRAAEPDEQRSTLNAGSANE
jgi:hypothetical protein